MIERSEASDTAWVAAPLAMGGFAVGVGALQWLPVLPEGWMLALAACVGAVLLTVAGRCRRQRWMWAVLGAVALGLFWAGARASWRLADALPVAWEARDITLVGVVAALPQRFERGERFAFDVESVETPGARVPGRIWLSWYHAWDEVEEGMERTEADAGRALHPGERWRLTVRLKRPHGNANPHGFDYEAWLLERGIRAVGSVRARAAAERLATFVVRPGVVVERLRDAVRERFLRELPDAPYVGVLAALAVGDQRAIPAAQWQIFNRTGVTHLVSISGLHVTMVAALCAALVNALWRRSRRLMLRLPAQKAAVAAGALAALAYALIAGFEVPAQRTFYMLGAVALALWSGRHPGAARTLLLALLCVLLIDPWAVLAVGFWLSFGAVAVLFLAGAGRIGTGDAPRRWRESIRQWGAAQWAVTVGSLPLLLAFFQQLSLVSPLANAVAIPLVSVVVTPLALLYAAVPWPPLLHVAHSLFATLMQGLEWLAGWPVWQQAAPSSGAVWLAAAGVVWMLLPRGIPARWLGVCLMVPLLMTHPARPADGEAWIDVLDVGQGLAVLVRTAGHALLYDTGPQYGPEANAGERVVVPFLRAEGVQRLDTLVVSHRDKDHAGGLPAILAYAAPDRRISSWEEVGGAPCVAGQSWEWDGVRFRMLHPEAAGYAGKMRPNNLSCVLRVENAGGSVLLSGDIEMSDERALVGREGDALRSEVLVVPHHGGRGSSSEEFVMAVAPRHVIFSAGYRNPFGHPREEVLARYAASRAWRTDTQGAMRVALDDATTTVSSWREAHPRYWHGQ